MPGITPICLRHNFFGFRDRTMGVSRAIQREPGANTDFLGSGHVPTQRNIGKSVGQQNPDVVAPMTIHERSLDKASAKEV